MNPVATCVAPIFVPAHQLERFAKAAASDADAIILDLEDAVPADAKDFARRALTTSFTQKPVIIRINGAGTPWHAADLDAVAALRPAAVMLPKAEDPALVAATAQRTLAPVMALIETTQGVANARALGACGSAMRLALGSVDLVADLGCDHVRDALILARGELVLASRLGRLPAPLDGVTTDFSDADLAADDARYARSLGFGGKMVIHPAQLGAVFAGFHPTDTEIAWALRVLASGDGAVAIDGMMVDEPVRRKARSILDRRDIAAYKHCGGALPIKEEIIA